MARGVRARGSGGIGVGGRGAGGARGGRGGRGRGRGRGAAGMLQLFLQFKEVIRQNFSQLKMLISCKSYTQGNM